MKLPFDFAIKLVFRLLIPGFFISLGLLPLLNTIVNLYKWNNLSGYIFVALVIISGWLIVISDMHIYMLLEGRRYWPDRVWQYFKRHEGRRLVRNLRRLRIAESEEFRQRKFDLLSKIESRISQLKHPSRRKLRLVRHKRRLKKDLATDAQKGLEAAFDIRNFPITESGDYFVRYPKRKDQFRIVTPYLQYQCYSCPVCRAILKPREIKEHIC